MMLIDPDYARIYTKLRCKAHMYGWGVMLHGSMTRDLDLLMVPWNANCCLVTALQCIVMLADSENLKLRNGEKPKFTKSNDSPHADGTNIDWSDKPHRRKATSLMFPSFGDPRFVDISIYLPWVPE